MKSCPYGHKCGRNHYIYIGPAVYVPKCSANVACPISFKVESEGMEPRVVDVSPTVMQETMIIP